MFNFRGYLFPSTVPGAHKRAFSSKILGRATGPGSANACNSIARERNHLSLQNTRSRSNKTENRPQTLASRRRRPADRATVILFRNSDFFFFFVIPSALEYHTIARIAGEQKKKKLPRNIITCTS